MLVLYQWLFAHLLADFGLQTTKMIRHKKRLKERSWILYAHALLHGVLVYLFSPNKPLWLIPVIVFVTHFFIDLWKLNRKDNALSFILDPFFHHTVVFKLLFILYQTF